MAAHNIIKDIPAQLLESKVSDEHIGFLGFQMKEWEEYAPVLGLKQSDVDSIKEDHKSFVVQAQKSLIRWKEKEAFKATNRRLIVIFCSVGRHNLAEKFQKLLLHLPDDNASQQDAFSSFQSYLKELYIASESFRHPSCTQWPFSTLQSYIDLSLFDVPINNDDEPPVEKGEQNKEAHLKPVKLENIFLSGNSQAKRKVLLLEGVAGSGKTTLSWHSCRKWAAGKLFKDIQLLIHVSLNDPDIASASSLADIIPHSSRKMGEAVAEAIEDKGGEGVCFLFDACDEFSGSWSQRSYLYRFIAGKGRQALSKCSILMTARPEVHQALTLAPLLTARVRTTGFEQVKLDEFLDASLSETQPQLRKEIQETFKINPELVGLCCLPLNATILVHLYSYFKDNLPKTTTGLFKPLVLNLLIRHVEHKENKCPEIKEFSNIPEAYLSKFSALCKLAFQAFEQRSRIIQKDMLRECGMNDPKDAMGFLQSHQQLTAFGSSYRCSFLHLSLQEFLAAIHIQHMSDQDQVQTVQKILRTNPLSPVISFYAGLTGLSNGGALDVLLSVTKHRLDMYAIFQELKKNPSVSADRRRPLLALINCIYETQRSDLCELVKPPMPKPGELHYCTSLWGLSMTPLDCLSLGFFLANTSMMYFELGVANDLGINVLITQLKSIHVKKPPIRVMANRNMIELQFNFISTETAKLLKDLVECSYMVAVSISDLGCSTKILQNIAGGVIHSSGRRAVRLRSLRPSAVNYLVVMLRSHNLASLQIMGLNFKFINPMLFAEAIKLSALHLLALTLCKIDDHALKHLADAICDHEHLLELGIALNPFSQDGLSYLLCQLLENNRVLSLLALSHYGRQNLNAKNKSLIEHINEKRRHFNCQELEIFEGHIGMEAEVMDINITASLLPPNILHKR